MRPRTDRQTHTDTQTLVTTIHFSWSTTNAKYNKFVKDETVWAYQSVLFCRASMLSCRTQHNKFDELWDWRAAEQFLHDNTPDFVIATQWPPRSRNVKHVNYSVGFVW